MEWKPTDVTILFVYCWISTCIRPTGPSSGEFIQLFTQPLVQFLCRSVRVLCAHEQSGTETDNSCVNSCTNSTEDGPVGPKHVEIQQYTNKIVTSVGFHSICWKDARYKKLKAQTCFGAVTPSSGRALFMLAKVTFVKTKRESNPITGLVVAQRGVEV